MAALRILVTGGTGFLGSEIVKKLAETTEYQITALDLNPPALGTGTAVGVRYVRANILKPEELDKVFEEEKPAMVVHTVGLYDAGAGRYNMKKRDIIFEVNVEGTRNVVEAAKKCGAKGLVYTSTFAVVVDELDAQFKNADETWSTGRATLAYGQSKTLAENLVLSSTSPSFRTCSLRPATIFGPHDPNVIPTIHALIPRCETPFIVGTGTNLVDFVYVANVADAHCLAVRNLLATGTAAGEAFYITNGEPVAFRDFCLAIWKEFGHVPAFEVRVPKALAWWLGWGAEWVTWATGMQASFNRGAVMDATASRYFDITKARRVLGYEPAVDLEDGVRISCQYYKRQLESQGYKKGEKITI